MSKGVAAVFRLADLMAMYTNRLEQFDPNINQRTNSTHVKDRILAAIPDLQAHKQGRDVLLRFNEYVGDAIRQAITNHYDDDALILAKNCKNCTKGNDANSSRGSLKLIVKIILFHNL